MWNVFNPFQCHIQNQPYKFNKQYRFLCQTHACAKLELNWTPQKLLSKEYRRDKRIDTSLGPRTVCALGLEYGLCGHYSEIQTSLKSRIRTEQRSISESGIPCDRYAIRQHHGSVQIGCKRTLSKIYKVTPRFYFYLAFQPRRHWNE